MWSFWGVELAELFAVLTGTYSWVNAGSLRAPCQILFPVLFQILWSGSYSAHELFMVVVMNKKTIAWLKGQHLGRKAFLAQPASLGCCSLVERSRT